MCHSYGLQFVSLDTEHEMDQFLEFCFEDSVLFDIHTLVGGISYTGNSKTDFYWMNSGNKIDYELKFGPGEPNNWNNQEYCLSAVKWTIGDLIEFKFNDYPCSKAESPEEFICQQKVYQ